MFKLIISLFLKNKKLTRKQVIEQYAKGRRSFKKEDLSNLDLSFVKLSSAVKSRANLTGTNLYCSNLCGTNLYNANLSGANMINAVLDYSSLDRTLRDGLYLC